MRLTFSIVVLTYAYLIYAQSNDVNSTLLNTDEMVTNALAKYNAVYNGTMTINLTTTPSSNCSFVDAYPEYSIQIGSRDPSDNKNKSLARSAFDQNLFYFLLESGPASNTTTNSGLGVESTHDYIANSTPFNSTYWSLSAARTKNGDAVDVIGTYTRTSRANFFWLPTCQPLSPGQMLLNQFWSMRGRITEEFVTFQWEPRVLTDFDITFSVSFNFTGQLDPRSPKLSTKGDIIETKGTWPFAVGTSEQNSGSSAGQARHLWLVYGLVSLFGLWMTL
jgi:hypothetical protein